jgi:polyhydroxyalkanoate synthesis repressor PhaR
MKHKDIVVIKKYSNRRLYDTQTSTYITLDDVRLMVRKGAEFEVRDAKTNEDLTRQILNQIIFDLELGGGQPMLPVNFLKRLISMYDNKLGDVFPYYLDGTMDTFLANQEKIQDHFRNIWGQYNPLDRMEAIQRRNVELMNNAMQLFNPFEYNKPSDKDKKD